MKENSAIGLKYLGYDFVRFTAAIPGLIWLRPKCVYRHPEASAIKGGALVCCNHISFTDPICLMIAIWQRRFRFIATKDFFDGKFKRFLFEKVFRCIEVDRDNVGIDTMRKGIACLKNGEVVALFPEGRIVSAAETLHQGAALMAIRSGKPIYPVCVAPPTSLPRRMRFAMGKPIRPTGDTMRDLSTITNELSDQMSELRKMLNLM